MILHQRLIAPLCQYVKGLVIGQDLLGSEVLVNQLGFVPGREEVGGVRHLLRGPLRILGSLSTVVRGSTALFYCVASQFGRGLLLPNSIAIILLPLVRYTTLPAFGCGYIHEHLLNLLISRLFPIFHAPKLIEFILRQIRNILSYFFHWILRFGGLRLRQWWCSIQFQWRGWIRKPCQGVHGLVWIPLWRLILHVRRIPKRSWAAASSVRINLVLGALIPRHLLSLLHQVLLSMIRGREPWHRPWCPLINSWAIAILLVRRALIVKGITHIVIEVPLLRLATTWQIRVDGYGFNTRKSGSRGRHALSASRSAGFPTRRQVIWREGHPLVIDKRSPLTSTHVLRPRSLPRVGREPASRCQGLLLVLRIMDLRARSIIGAAESAIKDGLILHRYAPGGRGLWILSLPVVSGTEPVRRIVKRRLILTGDQWIGSPDHPGLRMHLHILAAYQQRTAHASISRRKIVPGTQRIPIDSAGLEILVQSHYALTSYALSILLLILV